jgi:predicted nucleic acid-binding protein
LDIVIDTNVVAYALLGATPWAQESTRVLRRAGAILVPDLFRAEFANVLWQTAQAGHIARSTAIDLLDDTESLLTEVVPADQLWIEALSLSMSHAHPVYDTLFVALAQNRGLPLVSYDRRLRALFPETVIAAGAFLQQAS